MLRVEALSGDRLRPLLPQLAGLRIEVFRDWPYLYDGTLEYETWYLGVFMEAEGHVAICAFDGDEMIGASTAAPLRLQHKEFTAPFVQAGIATDGIFYFGESVLRAAYRGQGIGNKFFDGREEHAHSLGYTKSTFCAVRRSAEHPARPAEYRPLDPFWANRGYKQLTGVVAHFAWTEVGHSEESVKALQFWGKGFP